jgi:transposase
MQRTGLPVLAREVLARLLAQFRELDQGIAQYDCRIRELAKQSEASRRLMQVESIGPMTATAIVASMGNPHRVQERSQLCRLAGADAATALERRKDSPRPDHQTR